MSPQDDKEPDPGRKDYDSFLLNYENLSNFKRTTEVPLGQGIYYAKLLRDSSKGRAVEINRIKIRKKLWEFTL